MLRSIIRGALVAALGGAAAGAFGYSNLYVFGDSLSDVGNDFAAIGYPPSPYYEGRFSNGPIWVDYLASDLGLGALKPSSLGGTDYAYGGATVTPIGTEVPTIGQQIALFGASHTFSSTDLVTLWAGANDFLDGATNPASVATALEGDLNGLYALGARNVIVPNMPALGLLPTVQSQGMAAVYAADQLTLAFNADLAADIASAESMDPGLKVDGVDFYGYVNGIVSHAQMYGFTNVTGELIQQPAGTTGYLFWDDEHPTTAAHLLLANDVIQSLPEPPAYAVLGLGALCLLRPKSPKSPKSLKRKA